MNLNKVIFNKKVFYRVNDIAELFEVSSYKIKKAINECELETVKLKGFGNGLFISEANVNKLLVGEECIEIKTNVTTKQEEVEKTRFFSALSGVGKHMEEVMVEKKIEEFKEGVFDEEVSDNKLNDGIVEVNEKLSEENIAYRFIGVNLKNAHMWEDGQIEKGHVSVLVDKDSNIVATTFDKQYEINGDKICFDYNDYDESDDLEVMYNVLLPVEYGSVNIDIDKILIQLVRIAHNGGFIYDGFGGREYLNTSLGDREVGLLQHNKTVATKVTV